MSLLFVGRSITSRTQCTAEWPHHCTSHSPQQEQRRGRVKNDWSSPSLYWRDISLSLSLADQAVWKGPDRFSLAMMDGWMRNTASEQTWSNGSNVIRPGLVIAPGRPTTKGTSVVLTRLWQVALQADMCGFGLVLCCWGPASTVGNSGPKGVIAQ
jgi:hypothetical protein